MPNSGAAFRHMVQSGGVDPDRYFVELAACAVRGARADLPAGFDDAQVCAWAVDAGMRLHRFKRKLPLPRVERVLGALAQLRPTSLLDIGSGRGTFLWPLLDRFDDLPVTAIESDDERARQLAAVANGGLDRLEVLHADAASLAGLFEPVRKWDVATVLEVLEHVEDPTPVAAAVVGRAARAVIASVPSTPDDNPGHVRLFTQDALRSLLLDAGASRVSITQVPNHLVAVATGLGAS
ncbi:MAG: class I SAM-dependent methyltransferase [Microthrixaceae bacterium]|nr:class I SAM-dependent methyltransferase [Microthrixaceae bacterium]